MNHQSMIEWKCNCRYEFYFISTARTFEIGAKMKHDNHWWTQHSVKNSKPLTLIVCTKACLVLMKRFIYVYTYLCVDDRWHECRCIYDICIWSTNVICVMSISPQPEPETCQSDVVSSKFSLLVVLKVDETNPTFGWRVRETQMNEKRQFLYTHWLMKKHLYIIQQYHYYRLIFSIQVLKTYVVSNNLHDSANAKWCHEMK